MITFFLVYWILKKKPLFYIPITIFSSGTSGSCLPGEVRRPDCWGWGNNSTCCKDSWCPCTWCYLEQVSHCTIETPSKVIDRITQHSDFTWQRIFCQNLNILVESSPALFYSFISAWNVYFMMSFLSSVVPACHYLVYFQSNCYFYFLCFMLPLQLL